MLEEPPKPDPGSGPWKNWTYYYAMAIESTLPILAGALGGMWIDRSTSISPWGLMLGVVAGFAVSLLNLFRLNKKFRSET
ncbi:MAG: AtpZ/AtpI family protein [Nitrospirae bacterium]|nr:AtpZ/AtpI family protein [Nitrospirota bacterium]